VLALVGWQLLNRIILKPARGELFMEKVQGGNIASVPLTGKRRNRMKIKGKSLGNLVQLKDIRIRRADPLKKRKAGGSEPIEGIEIIAHTVKGEEIRGELYAERVLGRNNILKKPAMKTRGGERYQFRYEN